jgi:hypothetical protein
MPKFTRAADLREHLKKALDATVYETIRTAQGDLGSTEVSPYDTGRFRSSWFASEGSASSAVAPEGADSPNTDADGLQVDSRKEYHLTNSLPYAQRLCVEDYAVSQPKNWFIDYVNAEMPKNQARAAKAAKEQFDL